MHQSSAISAQKIVSLDEYIAHEEAAEQRHELINQELIPMPGTSDDHNEICFNLKMLLRQFNPLLKVYVENVKVQIQHEKDYTYPDVMVANDPRDTENKYIKKYPTVIFEVISKSSRLEDAVDKFNRYKQIDSLQDYILVDSEKILIEVRHKSAENQWEAATFMASDGNILIPSLGLHLQIADIYRGVFG